MLKQLILSTTFYFCIFLVYHLVLLILIVSYNPLDMNSTLIPPPPLVHSLRCYLRLRQDWNRNQNQNWNCCSMRNKNRRTRYTATGNHPRSRTRSSSNMRGGYVTTRMSNINVKTSCTKRRRRQMICFFISVYFVEICV